ncbi:MAG: hypothetical protein EA381_07420 [Planctomycetaceae bacterium]|nr:MAG: hypothetical protein EA381_07420 [Planctomycetaceae bacterium]
MIDAADVSREANQGRSIRRTSVPFVAVIKPACAHHLVTRRFTPDPARLARTSERGEFFSVFRDLPLVTNHGFAKSDRDPFPPSCSKYVIEGVFR